MEKMKSFQEDIMLSDRSELDEKYFHKSPKGKKLSDAEPKKRGTPARKRGISGELICSLTGVSRDGAAFAEIHNMGKPSQDDVENIAHHFSSGTFFWTDGTNCYDRLVKEKGCGSKKLVTWESYDEYNHLNNVNSLHSKMEERERKCHGVADKYLPRYCALWAKVHSLSGMDLSDKVRSVLGLYEKRRDDKRPKTSNLKNLERFRRGSIMTKGYLTQQFATIAKDFNVIRDKILTWAKGNMVSVSEKHGNEWNCKLKYENRDIQLTILAFDLCL